MVMGTIHLLLPSLENPNFVFACIFSCDVDNFKGNPLSGGQNLQPKNPPTIPPQISGILSAQGRGELIEVTLYKSCNEAEFRALTR